MLRLQVWKIHDFTTPPNDEQEVVSHFIVTKL